MSSLAVRAVRFINLLLTSLIAGMSFARTWQASTITGRRSGVIRSATSMVEVRRLISPEMLVWLEADAVMWD